MSDLEDLFALQVKLAGLPEEKQSVLALDRTGTAYHWEYSKCLSNIFVGYYTHWMPIPEPPEVKE